MNAVSPPQSPEDNVFVDLMDFSSITSDPEVGAVLCGLDMHMNYKKYARAFKYLRENEGCLFMATNLDSTFPTHGTVHPGGFSFSLSRRWLLLSASELGKKTDRLLSQAVVQRWLRSAALSVGNLS